MCIYGNNQNGIVNFKVIPREKKNHLFIKENMLPRKLLLYSPTYKPYNITHNYTSILIQQTNLKVHINTAFLKFKYCT